MPTLRTHLYDTHVALGGRMVPFAGYELPVQYPTGPLAEHEAVRTAAGLFDIDHMGQFRAVGPEADLFLQYIQTCDVSQIAVGEAHYGLLTYADGTIVDDIFLYHLPDHWMIAVNADNRAKDWTWMNAQAHGFDVELTDISDETYMLAFQGPKAESILQRLTPVNLDGMAARTCAVGPIAGIQTLMGRTGYTGEDGFELYFPADQAVKMWQTLLDTGKDDGMLACGLAARDSLRFEACMPLYGHEINAHVNPIEARLNWVVDFNKGDFIGREVLLKAKLEGTDQVLVGFEMVDRAVPRDHYDVAIDGQIVGHVTTGMKSPTLDKFLGMAYIPKSHSKIGSEIDIIVRDKPKKAVVVRRPFYKAQYK